MIDTGGLVSTIFFGVDFGPILGQHIAANFSPFFTERLQIDRADGQSFPGVGRLANDFTIEIYNFGSAMRAVQRRYFSTTALLEIEPWLIGKHLARDLCDITSMI